MNDLGELPDLDSAELELLAALRAEDGPAEAARVRVRDRLLEQTAAPPVTGRVVRGPWIVAGVVAVAAAALLAINFGGERATALADGGAQQAADIQESAATEGYARPDAEATPRNARHGGSRAPRAPNTAAEPSPPEVIPAPAPAAEAIVPPAAPKASVRSTRSKKGPAAAAPAPVPASSLAEETRLLDQARKAVKAGNPDQALAVLRDARARFPTGVLGQERKALFVVALCDAGKTAEGRAAASAFVRAFPRSALRSRVEEACPAAD